MAETIRKKLGFVVDPPLRDRLLAHALQEQEQSWTSQPAPAKPGTRRMIMRISTTKIVVAALVGAGVVAAAAVGVKYHYVDRDPQRGYLVQSEDGHSMMNIGDEHAASPEQAVARAEEIAGLKQQGQRELVGVIEIEVNGELDHRGFSYRYQLADGQTIEVYERDPDSGAPGTLTGERHAEAVRLMCETSGHTEMVMIDGRTYRVPAEGEEPAAYERVVQGRTFVFDKHSFTLSDGTRVAWSNGRLPEDGAGLMPGAITEGPIVNDLREVASLRRKNLRQWIAIDELTANGALDRRVFVYRYQLSDGRTTDMREAADAAAFQPILSAAQRREWAQAKNAGFGQELGAYEQEIQGHTFAFTRQRFVLGDGTELIWSYGKLKDNQ
jgi:hypothetical protein